MICLKYVLVRRAKYVVDISNNRKAKQSFQSEQRVSGREKTLL